MLPSALLEANLSKEDSARAQFPGSVLARFLELRGRRIVSACGALWYSVPGRFLMSLPYQNMLNPDPEELRRIIRETGLCGARFPSLNWTGLESGLYVLRRREYDIGSLHAKHRPRVRHAMQHFEVRPAEKSQLLDQGCALNLSTMARQGRYDPEFGELRRWERFVEAAFDCPGVSFPAVFSGSRLAAYMVTCREQGVAAHSPSDVAAGRPSQFSEPLTHLHGYGAGSRRCVARSSVLRLCAAVCRGRSARVQAAIRLRNGSSLVGDSAAPDAQSGSGPSVRAGRGAGGAALAAE